MELTGARGNFCADEERWRRWAGGNLSACGGLILQGGGVCVICGEMCLEKFFAKNRESGIVEVGCRLCLEKARTSPRKHR